MIKILYLINNIKEAGAQKHLLEVISGLDKNKFEPNLITLDDLGVKRIYDFSGIKGIWRLVKIMKKDKPDILHTYLFSENILGCIAARIAGIPVVVSSRRDTGMLREGKWQHILAYRLTNKLVDKILCVSEAVRKAVLAKEKVSPQKIEVIYNGVDIDKFQVAGFRSQVKESLGIKNDEFLVGMIANFSWIKGHKDFIETAEMVLKKLPNTKFLLIGSGELLESLRSQVTGLKLEDRIMFLGTRNDIPELLSIMDVSVNASYSEGMSNTILESMAAGVPVVATAVDGNLETVVDGISGILVPSKNPQAMAEAIIKILRNKNLAKRMGENAKKLLQQKFTSEIMVKNLENLYEGLLSPKIAYILSQFPELHEIFILREIKALEEKGVNIRILSLKPCKDKIIHEEARKLMMKTRYGRACSIWPVVYSLTYPIRTIAAFFYVVKSYWNNPKELIKAVYVLMESFYFARIIKKEQINHIHSHWATMPTTAAMILSKLTGISFSFTAHAWDIFVNCGSLEEKIQKAKFVATCTEYNRKFLSYFGDNGKFNKIYRNYHGIDLSKFRVSESMRSPLKVLRILVIGRLVETKGFEYLINACNILNGKGVNFECLIVGVGPLEKSLKSQARRFNLQEKVTFLGIKTQEEIKKLYSEATVLVQPSIMARNGDRDGIPNVILEAMAMKVPVIATDFSGIPEAIIDGKTGILVPEKDSSALANSIERIYNDYSLWKTIALNGRNFIAEKFDIDKNIGELINIFKENAVLN